jgi:hypothetical protein
MRKFIYIFLLLLICGGLTTRAQDRVLVTFSVSATATPDSICHGQYSQLNATVLGGTPPFTFSWSPATGLNHPAISNPIATPDYTILYYVTVTDNNSNTATDSVLLKVTSGPADPGPITGENEVCQGSVTTYSVPVNPAATSYSWTVPAGDTILSGQNTTLIAVKWDTASGYVSVIAENNCGISNPAVLHVTVVNSPLQPDSIFIPVNICQFKDAGFYVQPKANVQLYIWTVPTDVQVLSGQGTDTLHVLWGGTAGEVSVVAENSCNASHPAITAVVPDSGPDAAGMISGKDTICQGTSGFIYSIPVIDDASGYSWTLPQGTSITAGSGTNSITVAFSTGAVSGLLTVAGVNDCGKGPAAAKNLVIHDCTGIQIISDLQDVSVFPNPAEDRLTIAFENGHRNLQLSLTDMQGRILYRENPGDVQGGFTSRLDLTNYSRGLFFLKVIDSSGVHEFKIMIR